MKTTAAAIILISSLPLLRAETLTLTLTPEQDTDIYQYTTYPTSTSYSLGVNVSKNSGHSQKSLIKFPLTALLPQTLTTAKLRLYILENSATGSGFGGTLQPGLLSVYTQGKSWSAETARWSAISAETYLGDISVTQPSTATTPVWVELDATAAVRSWLTGTANHGFLLQGASETATLQPSVLFASMETGFKPQLVIQTTSVPPEIITPPAPILPTLSLTQKVPQTTTRRTLTLKGTTSASVQRVWYRLGSGSLKSIAATKPWKITLPLAKGKNQIFIYATDATGARSPSMKLRINRKSS
jgi:hypothetical protein